MNTRKDPTRKQYQYRTESARQSLEVGSAGLPQRAAYVVCRTDVRAYKTHGQRTHHQHKRRAQGKMVKAQTLAAEYSPPYDRDYDGYDDTEDTERSQRPNMRTVAPALLHRFSEGYLHTRQGLVIAGP